MTLRFYQKVLFKDDVDPDAHRWLVKRADGLFLFVDKETDRWTPFPRSRLINFVEVPPETVPPDVRRRAHARATEPRGAA